MTTAGAGSVALACSDGAEAPTLRRGTIDDVDQVVALQHAAYARNRDLLGLEPLPLLVDYKEIFATHEIWLHDNSISGVAAALILEPRETDILIFSVATDPRMQATGIGRQLLSATDIRARQLGHDSVRLYTGSTLKHLIDWYSRNGFSIEHIEQLRDRAITHMVKHLN